MSGRLWTALSFACYALPTALLGAPALGWTALVDACFFATIAVWFQGMIGRCFDRARPAALLIGGLASCVLLFGAVWLLTVGPVRTRSGAYYGHRTAVEYAAWLKRHGKPALVGRCRPLRTGLQPYGRPSFYSCAVDSSRRCLLRSDGFHDFGAMSAARCSYLAND